MNMLFNIENTRFIHSAKDGVSIGYAVGTLANGKKRVRVALAFTNFSQGDQFTKELARKVILRRLNHSGIQSAGHIIEYDFNNNLDLSVEKLIDNIWGRYTYFRKNLGKDRSNRLFWDFLDSRFSYGFVADGIKTPLVINDASAFVDEYLDGIQIETRENVSSENKPIVLGKGDDMRYYIASLDGFVKFFHNPERKASIGYVEDADYYYVAISACHPNDVYSKKISRIILTERFKVGKYVQIAKNNSQTSYAFEEDQILDSIFNGVMKEISYLGDFDVTVFNIPRWRVVDLFH